jgi:hypothetical protein
MNNSNNETQNNYNPFERPLRESDDSLDDLKKAFELQKRKEDK